MKTETSSSVICNNPATKTIPFPGNIKAKPSVDGTTRKQTKASPVPAQEVKTYKDLLCNVFLRDFLTEEKAKKLVMRIVSLLNGTPEDDGEEKEESKSACLKSESSKIDTSILDGMSEKALKKAVLKTFNSLDCKKQIALTAFAFDLASNTEKQ